MPPRRGGAYTRPKKKVPAAFKPGLPAPAFKPQQKKAKAKTRRAKAKLPAKPTPTPQSLPPRGDVTSPKQIPKAVRKDFTKAKRGDKTVYVRKGRAQRIQRRQQRLARQRLLEARRTQGRSTGSATPKKPDLKVAGVNVDALKRGSGSAVSGAGRGAVDILEETLRPNYAIAGATRAAIKGENVLKAARRGIEKKDTYQFADVLKEAGIKNVPVPVGTTGRTVKVPREAAGFVLDVGTDPLTYVTGGVGSVAAKGGAKAGQKAIKVRRGKVAQPKETGAARKAAQKAYRRERARGASPEQARGKAKAVRQERVAARQQARTRTLDARAARRAERRTAARLPEGRGVQVGFGRFQTSGRATEMMGRPLRAARPDRVRKAVRHVASGVSPRVRPTAAQSPREAEGLRALGREARSAISRGTQHAVARASAVSEAIPPKLRSEVIDAVERGTVGDLGNRLAAKVRRTEKRKPNARELAEIDRVVKAARVIEREFKAARKAERKAGIETAQVSGSRYFAHMLDEALEGSKKGTGGGRTVRAEYTGRREHRGRISQIAEEGGPEFSKNIPKVMANRLARSSRDVALARFAQGVAQTGRKVTGSKIELRPGEGLYAIQDGRLAKVDVDSKAGRQLLASDSRPTLVAANERTVDRQLQNIAPYMERGTPGRALDSATGKFKFVVTVPNPGFHMRNLIGDTQNAWLGQSAGSLARSTGTSARMLRQLGKREEAARTLGGKPRPAGATVTLKDRHGRKSKVRVDDLLKEAERAGVIRQGFYGREIPELWKATRDGEMVKRVRSGGGAKAGRIGGRLLTNREDLMRLATYVGARKKGLTPRRAADKTMGHHFDYGDLSRVERSLFRRLLPFYVFSSRNIPLHGKTLMAKPGKFGTVEKMREAFADAQGVDLRELEKDLKDWQIHGVPFPIRDGENVYVIGSENMLPLTGLAQIPFPGVGFDETLDRWLDEGLGLLNPIFKHPIELLANHNFFFKEDIEREYAPRTAVPGALQGTVGRWPKAVRERLGIRYGIVNKRTGEKRWSWPAKVDYSSKVLMLGPVRTLEKVTSTATGQQTDKGQGLGTTLLDTIGGVKISPVDREGARIGRLMEKKKVLESFSNGLAQDEMKETRLYRQARGRIAKLQARISELSRQRGDAQVLGERAGRAKPSALDAFRSEGSSTGGGSGLDEFRTGGSSSSGSALDAFR